MSNPVALLHSGFAGGVGMGYMLSSLPYFLAYFVSAILLAVIFLTAYVAITPHKEFSLIRDGNTAAALQLVGTFCGWTVPMAVVIGFSHHLIDMVIWGVVSLVTQLLIFFVISRILFRGIEARISNNCNASGLFVGGVGIALLIHLSRLLYSRTVPGPSDGGTSRDVGPYRACSIPA